MSNSDLNKIFAPRSIAVVGASTRAGSVGNRVVRNLKTGGFSGAIHPVNKNHRAVEDMPCFARIGDVPAPVDLAIVCTPADQVPEVVGQCGEASCGGLILLSAGFAEIGERGRAREEQLRRVGAAYPAMRFVGPNCLGVLRPRQSLWASFSRDPARRGNIALLSQSGSFCAAILDRAHEEGIGFSLVVSVGNMVDIGMAELIDYLADDPHTEAIVMYVQSVRDARRFMSAARAFTRNKPIIACKSGRFERSALAAASHTGAMVGLDRVYDAAFARAGIVRVDQPDDLWSCAELLATQSPPKGRRLTIVTNAGGPGVMAADAALQRDVPLADLSDATQRALHDLLPGGWSAANPVDVFGDATTEQYAGAVEAALADPNSDAVVAVFAPQPMSEPTPAAEQVAAVAAKHRKPLLTTWLGGDRVREGRHVLQQASVPTYDTPEKAVTALGYLVDYARRREILYETPRSLSVQIRSDPASLGSTFASLAGDQAGVWSQWQAKELLSAYGVPVTPPVIARSADEAVQRASLMGFPVAMKILASELTHKSDVGGVLLNINDAAAVRSGFDSIFVRCHDKRPDVRVEGVTIEPMKIDPTGRELIVGAKRDPVFGSVLMVGAGGINAELFHDSALELPPLNERLADRMLRSLKCWPMLGAFRGKPAVDVDRLIETLIRISYLVANHPAIIELDINPLLVTPTDITALDATIVSESGTSVRGDMAYPHLAIRPYPDQYIKTTTLPDGTSLLLRPIRPEDEPLWKAMMESCSQETIRLRFRYLFKGVTHDLASRFCFNDYDRELAMVAEIREDDQRKLIGVGRLVTDVNRDEVEYAVMVADPWQGRRLGSLLTDECLTICQSMGVRRVVAEAATENKQMRQIFRRRGFDSRKIIGDDTVILTKDL